MLLIFLLERGKGLFHADSPDGLKVCGHRLLESIDLGQVLGPPGGVGQHCFCKALRFYLRTASLGIERSEDLKNLRAVLDQIRLVSPASLESRTFIFGSFVEADQGGEGEHQKLGQLAVFCNIPQEGRKVPGFELGNRVQGDGEQLVGVVRILKALQNIGCIRLKLLFRAFHRRDDLLEDALVHEREEKILVGYAVLDGLMARLIGCKYAHGMGSVEDADLACAVEAHIVGPYHVQACLIERQLILVEVLVAFDDPQVENLGRVEQVVLIAELGADCLCFGSRVTGNDAVDQGVAEITSFVEPGHEACLQVPLLCILFDDALQIVSVLVDELAGNDDQALVRSPVESLVAFVEEGADLGWEGDLDLVGQLVTAVVADTGLGGVGDDEAQVLTGCELYILLVIVGLVRIEAAADAVDRSVLLDGFLVLHTPEDGGVQALLGVDHIAQAPVQGLDEDYIAVEIGLLVENVDHPIDERSEEVPLSELKNLLFSLYSLVNIGD
ncbi:hypothetical protein SDC9_44682 [bioreactor metagenome]|uniref:NAD-specific glutamate dehydrogenase n=1 Tax=bioreactor metagenome TaxID=1076179 RepID=A0A644W4G6_9ZZZZ